MRSEISGGYQQAASAEEALQRLQELETERRRLAADLVAQRTLRASLLALHEPTALQAERAVGVCLPNGREVKLSFRQDAALAQGGLLWSSGVILARYIARQGLLASSRQPLRVLEIGCGSSALPSLVTSCLPGTEVVATDLSEVVELAVQNRKHNQLVLSESGASDVLFLSHDYSQAAYVEGAPFDVLLLADLLYDGALQEALLSSVAACVQPDGGVAFVAYKERDAAVESAFFTSLSRPGASADVADVELCEGDTEDLDATGLRLKKVQFRPQKQVVGQIEHTCTGLYLDRKSVV